MTCEYRAGHGSIEAEVNVHSRESNVGARSDLKQLLASVGPLPVAQAAELMLRVCEALAHVHATGSVHGNLSPAKIAITINDDDTMDAAVIASDAVALGAASDDDAWSYLAPEQLRGNDARVNARADLWAVGAILHELLSGERAFSAPTRDELASKIETQQPTPLRNLRRDVPPGMDTLVLYCLEKKPDGRPPSVGHVASALGRFVPADARGAVARIHSILRQHRPSSDPHSSDLAMAASRPNAIITPLGSLFPQRPVWRQRAKLGAAGVGFVVVCGVVGHFLRREPAVSRTVSASAPAAAAPASSVEMIVEEDAIQVLRPDELPAAPVVDVSALPAKRQRTGDVAPSQPAPIAAASSEPTDTAPAEPASSAPGVAPEAVELTEDEGASGGGFDAAAAKASIASAAARAGACHDGTSAPQKALVTITFAPSGEASAVSVTGALSGTPTAACVEQLFRGVTVPAFTGDSVTVSRTVSVGN